MLTTLKLNGFTGIPYLAGSQLMAAHPDGLTFSTSKPNAIVGPNGAGKSALLQALSFLTLSNLTGRTTLDSNYTSRGRDAKPLWQDVPDKWRTRRDYLVGLVTDYDGGRALYYRAGHFPGNETFTAGAICRGYGRDAQRHAALTRHKSAGQQTQALQEEIMAVLRGTAPMPELEFHDWHGPRTIEELEAFKAQQAERRSAGTCWHSWEDSGEGEAGLLVRRYAGAQGMPMALLDEPEISLDARAEATMWQDIENTIPGIQVIVATHSFYPMLHPDRFNIIETEPGFAADVLSRLGLSSIR